MKNWPSDSSRRMIKKNLFTVNVVNAYSFLIFFFWNNTICNYDIYLKIVDNIQTNKNINNTVIRNTT